MEPGKPSRTAVAAAFYRAYHFEHGDPPIFRDGYAERLLTPEERREHEGRLIDGLAALEAVVGPAPRDRSAALRRAIHETTPAGHVVARARYTEDRLSKRGMEQYVIVGAGLDTFAFRRTDRRVQVFEVDHPTTQAMKRSRLAAAGLVPPPDLHFVSADFERETVADALARAPFAPDRPALFAWLGVTMYLTREAVLGTFAAVRRSAAPGSEVVFDYLDAAGFDAGTMSPLFRHTMQHTREVGEPIIFGFDPAALPGELAAAGLRLLEDLGPAELGRRYFDGRSDGLRARPHVHVACAEVAQGRTPV